MWLFAFFEDSKTETLKNSYLSLSHIHTHTHTHTDHHHGPKIKAERRRHKLARAERCSDRIVVTQFPQLPARRSPGWQPQLGACWFTHQSGTQSGDNRPGTRSPRNQRIQLLAECDPPPPSPGWRGQARWCSVCNPICRPLLQSQVPTSTAWWCRKC